MTDYEREYGYLQANYDKAMKDMAAALERVETIAQQYRESQDAIAENKKLRYDLEQAIAAEKQAKADERYAQNLAIQSDRVAQEALADFEHAVNESQSMGWVAKNKVDTLTQGYHEVIAGYEQAAKEKDHKLDSLQGQLNSAQRKASWVDQLQDKLNRETELRLDVEDELAKARVQLRDEDRKKLKDERDQLIKANGTLIQSVDKLRSEIATLPRPEVVRSLQQRASDLEIQLRSQKEGRKAAEGIAAYVDTDTKQLAARIEELEEETREKRNTIVRLRTTVGQYEVQNKALKQALTELKEELNGKART